MLSATAAGCNFGFGGAFDGGNWLGDACWLFCDGGLSIGSGGCAHGTASCGADASACETPTLSNDSNCGGCGVRCPTGHTCAGGSCFAIEELARWPNAYPQPANGLAVGDGYAYLALMHLQGFPSGLLAVPVSGGSTRTLTRDTALALFADGQGVYFVDEPDGGGYPLLTMGPMDPAPRTVLPDAGALTAIIGTSPQSVFYGLVGSGIASPGQLLAEVSKAGGGMQAVLATDEQPPANGAPFAAVGASGVYWIDRGNVFAQTLADAGAASQLSTDGAAIAIAASANAVYALTASGAMRYDVTTGTWATISTQPVAAASLAADDAALYLASGSLYSDSQIVRLGADGTRTVLAGAQPSALSIAIDDTYAYWWTFDFGDGGSEQTLVLRRVPKSP